MAQDFCTTSKIRKNLVLGGEYCIHYRQGIKYCDYGCCGRTLQQYCCVLAVWIIVLIVLGILLLLSIAVFLFVFYYCKKLGRTNGRVVHPGDMPQTQTVSTVHTVQYQGQVYATAPPPYSAAMYPTAPYQPSPQQDPSSNAKDNSHLKPAVYDSDPVYGNQASYQLASRLNPAYPPTGLYSST